MLLMMKKLLGILVLGLLLNGCATVPSQQVQKQLIDQGTIKTGMSYSKVLDILGGSGAAIPIYPFRGKGTANEHVYLEPFVEYNSKSYYYSFKADTSKKTWAGWYKLNFYRLDKIWNSYPEMLDYYLSIASNPKDIQFLANKKTSIERYESNKSASSNSTGNNTQSKISQAKEVCTEIGFEPGSDKFSDCTSQVVQMNFELEKSQQASKIVVKDADAGWDALIKLGEELRTGGSQKTTSTVTNRPRRCVSQATVYGQVITNCN